MTKALIAGSVLLFIAGSVAAQAADQTGANQPAAPAPQSSSQAPGSAMSIREDIQSNLAKAGYTDVQVMPSSFLVHAKDSKGEPVAMVIGPDFMTSVTEVAPSGTPNGSKAPAPTANKPQ